MSEYDLNKNYIKYCEDVITGKILACQDVILACKRFKSWFEKEDRWFDYDEVDKRIRLVSKMKHFRGEFNNKPFILLPFQEFIFSGIFGFKWKSNNTRVIRNVLIFCARKNAKTSLAAAICLTQLILDNNNGQEIDFIASSGAQARIGFEITKNYAESLDPNGLIFSRYRDSIKMPSTKSEIDVRNSDAMTLDGLNSSTFIADEAHSYKTPDLWNVLKSSQGAQSQPLSICITTAGFLLDSYFLYEWVKTCKDILRGDKEDETQFSLLYSLDAGDDWADESKWIKSNPALYDIVSIDYLRDECKNAKNQASLEYGFRTKLMNQFCQSNNTWISSDIIRNNMVSIPMSSFDGKEYTWAGVDLSSTKDLTCFTIMWKPSKKRSFYDDKYIFKTWIYVSAYGVETSPNKSLYKYWIENGYLKQIEGNVIDYDIIMNDILEQKAFVRYDIIGYDKFNASQFVINCEKKGLPMQPFSQTLGSFNLPTKEFERLILSDKVIIDYNPLVLWAFNNVALAIDTKTDNIKPDKPTKEAKIDPVITIVEALGTYLYSQGLIGTGDTEIYTGINKDGNNK